MLGFVVLSHLGTLATVHAQSAAARVRQLTTDAMNAFHELDLDRADALLLQARTAMERETVEASIAARVHLSMGVIAVSGHGDAQRAQQSFMRALELDPTVEPDPMTSTPEVASNFQIAKARRASIVRSTSRTAPDAGTPPSTTTPAATTPSTPTVPRTQPAPSTPAATPPSRTQPAPSTPEAPVRRQFPTVRHTPPPEALSNTPLPLYLEVADAPDANRVVVMYRGHGMRRYMQMRLPAHGQGFGGELPCANVVVGDFVYYVVVYDSEARVIAGAGSDSVPLRVRVVERLSGRAPSLPGRPAPGICTPGAPTAAPTPAPATRPTTTASR